MELQKKFFAVEDYLNKFYTERHDLIRYSIMALLTSDEENAGTHLCVVSTPGCAKSSVIRKLVSFIENDVDQNVKTFWYGLFHSHIKPEEFVGPVDIKELTDNGKVVRKGENFIQNCYIAFSDEIWKAKEVLSAKLQLMNEREIQIDGLTHKVPLMTDFGASNEWPTDKELEALYDRFLYRLKIDAIKSYDDLVAMLMVRKDKKAYQALSQILKPNKIKLSELMQAQKEIDAVEIPDAVIKVLASVYMKLFEMNIEITNRRHNQVMSALRTAAWLEGRMVVEDGDISVLWPCLWVKEEDIPRVKTMLNQTVNRQLDDIYQAYDSIRVKVQGVIDKSGSEVIKVSDDVKKIVAVLENLTVLNKNQREYNKLMIKIRAVVIPLNDRANNELALAKNARDM